MMTTRMRRRQVLLIFAVAATCFAILSVIRVFHISKAVITAEDEYENPMHSDKEVLDQREFHGEGVEIKMDHNHGHEGQRAKDMYKKVRVLCWILTAPKNLAKKATAVKKTWAKRCNKYIFFSSDTNSSFPTVGLNVSEGRQHLTAKTMRAFAYCYAYHLNDFDWFLKADDDSYVIVENLRYFLSHYNSTDPVYFGHKFKKVVPGGYMSGGGGYVLSRESLTRLVERGMRQKLCRTDGGAEDAEMGKCLLKVGVIPANSIDIYGRETFHPFKPISHMEGRFPPWYYIWAANKIKQGLDCCSDYSITFHYVSPSDIYVLDYLLYHLRPFGTSPDIDKSRVFPSLREQGIDVT